MYLEAQTVGFVKWLGDQRFSRLLLLLACCGGALSFPGPARAQSQNAWIVDVMVLYTSDAKTAAGGDAAMTDLIRAAVAEGNLVFGNSHAPLRLRCVYQGEIGYDESGRVLTDLNRLRDPSDGFLDSVAVLRDRYAADLVCLVVERGGDYEFYGLQGPSVDNAFSVIRRRSLAGLDYFPVALSFNFGCQLDRPYADSAGAFSFSYGYTFNAGGQRFSTVEAFSGSARLPLFSNPDITVLGEPAGVSEGFPVPCNNAKTLRLTAGQVAAFRGATTQTTPPEVSLLSPTDGQVFTVGDALQLEATPTAGSAPVSSVEFIDGAVLMGKVTSAPYSLAVTVTNSGQHPIMAVAYDEQGVSSVSQPAMITVRPANDQFANAIELTGVDITTSGSCRAATVEPGEPVENPTSVYKRDKTVWWKWTAPASTRVTVGVQPRSSSYENLAVYTGSVVSNLTLVNTHSKSFEFDADSGVTYYLCVSADDYTEGDFDLRLQACGVELLSPESGSVFEAGTNLWLRAAAIGGFTNTDKMQLAGARYGDVFAEGTNNELSFLWTNVPPGRYELYAFAWDDSGNRMPSRPARIRVRPANDDFDNRIPLVSSTNSLAATTVGAGLEPGETGCGGGTNEGTVWWSFVSPGKGRLWVAGYGGSSYSLNVSVYTGNVLSNLDECNYITMHGSQSYIRTLPGVAYAARFCGDSIDFNLSCSWLPAPPNDDFADAAPVVGTSVTNVSDFAGATLEPGEPEGDSFNSIASVWYTWVAPTSGRVVLAGDSTIRGVAVYTGDALTNLALVLSRQQVTGSFMATAGTTYRIELTGGGNEASWRLNLQPGPGNDAFASRTVIPGSIFSTKANNTFATKEPGEPDHAGDAGGASLWWSWTAPADGELTLTVTNSDSSLPLLAVYAGNNLSNLVMVAADRMPPPTFEYIANPLTFPVEAGVTYQIAADGYLRTLVLGRRWNAVDGRIWFRFTVYFVAFDIAA